MIVVLNVQFLLLLLSSGVSLYATHSLYCSGPWWWLVLLLALSCCKTSHPLLLIECFEEGDGCIIVVKGRPFLSDRFLWYLFFLAETVWLSMLRIILLFSYNRRHFLLFHNKLLIGLILLLCKKRCCHLWRVRFSTEQSFLLKFVRRLEKLVLGWVFVALVFRNSISF